MSALLKYFNNHTKQHKAPILPLYTVSPEQQDFDLNEDTETNVINKMIVSAVISITYFFKLAVSLDDYAVESPPTVKVIVSSAETEGLPLYIAEVPSYEDFAKITPIPGNTGGYESDNSSADENC